MPRALAYLALSVCILGGCNRNPTIAFQNLAPKFVKSYSELEKNNTIERAKGINETASVEFDPGFEIDVKKTDSTISPYVAVLELTEKCHYTNKDGTENVTLNKTIHFLYQDNKWIYNCSDFSTRTTRDYWVEDHHLDNLSLNGLPDETCDKALAMVQ